MTTPKWRAKQTTLDGSHIVVHEELVEGEWIAKSVEVNNHTFIRPADYNEAKAGEFTGEKIMTGLYGPRACPNCDD